MFNDILFPIMNLKSYLFLLLVSGDLFIPQSKCFASGITGISIITPGPIDLNCGSSTMVQVKVNYFRDATDESSYSFKIRLFQDNGKHSDDMLSGVWVDMPMLAGNQSFTVDMMIQCDIQDPPGKCDFSGGGEVAMGQSPHKIFAGIGTISNEFSSSKVEVNCKKPTGALCYVIPQSNSTHRNENTPVNLTIASPVIGVKYINILIKQDPSALKGSNVAFTSAFLAQCTSASIDTTIPGQIRLRAQLNNSMVIANPVPFASYTIRALGNAPYNGYLLNVDTASRILAQNGQLIDAQLGAMVLSVLPIDATAPTINCGSLIVNDTSISGKSGTITDAYLNISGYVNAALILNDSLLIGSTDIDTSGSFFIGRLHLVNGMKLKLVVSDKAGNRDSCTIVINLTNSGSGISQTPKVVCNPNPSNGLLEFKISRSVSIFDAVVVITDIQGKEIMHIEDIHSNEFNISIGRLASGNYYFRIITKENIFNGKFLKE